MRSFRIVSPERKLIADERQRSRNEAVAHLGVSTDTLDRDGEVVEERGGWETLERGLIQRVKALNLFLADLYGAQEILKAGVIPSDLIYRNPAFRPEMANWNVPPAASQSLQAQRTKLAAASFPEELDQTTKQLIGRAIAESFVHAFRLIMAIGAALAVVSAIVAWLLIGTAAQKEYSSPSKAFAD